MYGSFRTLTDKIQEYLTADSPNHLFAKILERLEQDFEKGSNSRYAIFKCLYTEKGGNSRYEL